jgi:hypothetical protein
VAQFGELGGEKVSSDAVAGRMGLIIAEAVMARFLGAGAAARPDGHQKGQSEGRDHRRTALQGHRFLSLAPSRVMLFNQQTSVVFQSLAFVLGAVHARIGLKSFDSDHFSATLDAFGPKKVGSDDHAACTDAFC